MSNNDIELMKKFEQRTKKIINKENMQEILNYILENNQAIKVIKDANLLLDNKLLFNNKWDMEMCNYIYTLKKGKWNRTPNKDKEWVFMLNRFEYSYKLILAYMLKKDKRYIDKWESLLLDWKNTNEKVKNRKIDKIINRMNRYFPEIFSKYTKISMNRPLDIAIRVNSLLLDLIYLVQLECITSNKFYEIYKWLETEVKKIYEEYNQNKDKYDKDNWGIIQVCAILNWLFITGEYNTQKDIYQWSIKKIKQQLEYQVFSGGEHLESSPMYHVEVLLNLMGVIYVSQKLNIEIEDKIKSIAKQMAYYTYNTAMPNNCQIEYGDSDRTDITDVMYMATLTFDNSYFKNKMKELISCQFLYKIPEIEKFNSLDKIELIEEREILKYPDSGTIIIKDIQNKNYLFMNNGDCYSGHKHADVGHFILVSQNKEFLVDSGRFSYTKKNRKKYKMSKAHNISTIDGKEMYQLQGLWGFKKHPKRLETSLKKYGDIVFTCMRYSSIIKNQIIQERDFIVIEGNIWVLINAIEYKGKHICTNYYHYDNQVKLALVKEKQYKAMNQGKILYVMHMGVNQIKKKKAKVSILYNTEQFSELVKTKTKFKDKLLTVDVFTNKEISVEELKINSNITCINIYVNKKKYEIYIDLEKNNITIKDYTTSNKEIILK